MRSVQARLDRLDSDSMRRRTVLICCGDEEIDEVAIERRFGKGGLPDDVEPIFVSWIGFDPATRPEGEAAS